MTAAPETQPMGVLLLDGRALSFGYRLGADGLLVLLDLAAHAVASSDGPLVAASYRDIGRRVGLSKDTVGRRIAVLRRTGVLVDRAGPAGDRFEFRCYLLRLDAVGIHLDNAVTGGVGPSQTAPGAVQVWRACRELRRELRPLAWAVLEDVALDAELEQGRMIARTSARRLAEHLGIDPGTAAGALRSLRQRQLLALERESGPAGRFGLSVYVLGGVTGLTIAPPEGDGPMAPTPREHPPRPAEPDVAEPRMEEPCPARPSTASLDRRASSRAALPAAARPARRKSRDTAASEAEDQATLDFEWGTAGAAPGLPPRRGGKCLSPFRLSACPCDSSCSFVPSSSSSCCLGCPAHRTFSHADNHCVDQC